MSKEFKTIKNDPTYNDSLGTTVYDADSDPIKCIFSGDGCIHIDSESYSYIDLTIDNLYEMIGLIRLAENELKKRYD